ncbi:hypothetical protein GGX14DRAFT_375359 [Mycena pura]|uniref:Uncharacterized protein n=1 Tax=Mycena pura TaxID=153505 RepID=A0AAD6Y582_9AGAR|nr:hypothetical protein GGX14DRAFT_375359 [Mycena pura]
MQEQCEAVGEQDLVVEQVAVSDPPEPATLAQHIRALITSLPTAGPECPPVKTDPPPLDADGRPIPPPGAIRIKDPKLVKLLSDPDFMNGSEDNGRASVWEALDALDVPKYRKPTSSDDTPGQSDGEPGGDDVQSQGDVMLYCPLHPTEDSAVELANMKVVEVPVSKMDSFHQSRWNFLWSITVGLVRAQTPQTKLVKTWVPSTTKISFQAMWWGYRIYLPPPIMAKLSSEEGEVLKIAGTITAALTWLLAHVDPYMVPPPLLPVFLLIRKLGPYVGYIGTFIAWIWGAVENEDKGNGVCMTATWILPVALIPSAIKVAATTPATSSGPVAISPASTPNAPTTSPAPASSVSAGITTPT